MVPWPRPKPGTEAGTGMGEALDVVLCGLLLLRSGERFGPLRAPLVRSRISKQSLLRPQLPGVSRKKPGLIFAAFVRAVMTGG